VAIKLPPNRPNFVPSPFRLEPESEPLRGGKPQDSTPLKEYGSTPLKEYGSTPLKEYGTPLKEYGTPLKEYSTPSQRGTEWGTVPHSNSTGRVEEKLSKLQVAILYFLVASGEKSEDSEATKLAVTEIAAAVESSKNTVKKTISRLKKLELIRVTASKRGQNGWATYSVSSATKEWLLAALVKSKKGAEWGTEWGTEGVHSSSSSEKTFPKTTTTLARDGADLYPGLDLSPLIQVGIFLGLIQLRQLQAMDIEWETLQRGIYHFAWEVRNKRIVPQNGEALFISLFRKHGCFHSAPYQAQIGRVGEDYLSQNPSSRFTMPNGDAEPPNGDC
jgi:hypothetical protein